MSDGTDKGEGNAMNKPSVRFDFNIGTLLPLLVAVISLVAYIKNIEGRVETQAQSSVMRSSIADNFYAGTNKRLDELSDIPLRVKAVEDQQKEIRQELTRIADAVIAGQDRLRSDLSAAIEPVRKDIANLSTRVEVIADRVGGRVKPEAGIYRPH